MNFNQAIKGFVLASFLFLSFGGRAQYSDWLKSDRPGQSINPFTVGKNTMQIQTGYEYLNLDRKRKNFFNEYVNLQDIQNNYHGRLRVGLLEQVEGSMGIHYFGTERLQRETGKRSNAAYIRQLDLNLRVAIYEGRGAIPALGIELQLAILNPFEEVRYEKENLSTVFTMQSEITNKFSLTANVVFDDKLGLTLNGRYQFHQKFSMFAEFYSTYIWFLDNNKDFQFSRNYLNSGLIYSFGPNLQIDLATNLLIEDSGFEAHYEKVSNYFGIRVGITGRLDWRD